MSRETLCGKELRQELLAGVNILAEGVTATLGPHGRTVILERNPMWPPHVTRDGISVAKEIRDLKSPWQNAGAHLVRDAAQSCHASTGDGTTTATLLAQVIFQKGIEALDKGASPVALKRGIDKTVAVVVDHLKSIAQPVETDEQIIQVGMISAHGDRHIGELIARAMAKVGRDGLITHEDSNGTETTLKITEGMQIDRGFWPPNAASFFMMDKTDKLNTVLVDPFILLTERKLTSMTPELQFVIENEILPTKKPILFIAGDFDGPMIASLIQNIQQGVMFSVPVKAPDFGDQRAATLEDIATMTGGYAFTENCGRKLESITIEDFGRAERVVVDQVSTTITGTCGDKDKIEKQVAFLRTLIDATENPLDKERLKQRLAKLAGGVAVIRVGAATEAEQKELKDRVDDAICATRAAVAEGIVPGGGKALLSAIGHTEWWVEGLEDEGEKEGGMILSSALGAPLRKIMANAGIGERAIIEGMASLGSENDRPVPLNYGYNAATGIFEDLIAAGVIDPCKVTRTALQKAASVAATLLSTEAMVCTIPEKK